MNKKLVALFLIAFQLQAKNYEEPGQAQEQEGRITPTVQELIAAGAQFAGRTQVIRRTRRTRQQTPRPQGHHGAVFFLRYPG